MEKKSQALEKEKLLNNIVEHAPVSDALLNVLVPNLRKQPLSDLNSLWQAVERGNRAAESSLERANANLGELAIEQDKLDRIVNALAGSLSDGLSSELPVHNPFQQARLLSEVLDRTRRRISAELVERALVSPVDESHSSIMRHMIAGEILPLRVVDHVASALDVHKAIATVECLAKADPPDLVIGINQGGGIVCNYLEARFAVDSPSIGTAFHVVGIQKSGKLLADGTEFQHPRLDVHQINKITVVDDISRTGDTISYVKQQLSKIFPRAGIRALTLIATYNAARRSFDSSDFSAFLTDLPAIKMPYDSHGGFSKKDEFNIFGNRSSNMSITDNEADRFLREISRNLGSAELGL